MPNAISPEAYLNRVRTSPEPVIECWRSEAVERRDGSEIQGLGLFALEDIPAGTLVAIKPGKIVSGTWVKDHADIIGGSQQQIDDNMFLVGTTPDEVSQNLVGYNHSCDPNARVEIDSDSHVGLLITNKDVKTGEEITADYSVSQNTNTHDIFVCECGATECRHIVQPNWDWLDKDFRDKHRGEFAPFIQVKIDELESADPQRHSSILRHQTFFMLAHMITYLSKMEADPYFPQPEPTPYVVENKIGQLLVERPIRIVIQAKERRQVRAQLLEATRLFVIISPLANFKYMGIDTENPSKKSIKKHLRNIIDFANKQDYNFN